MQGQKGHIEPQTAHAFNTTDPYTEMIIYPKTADNCAGIFVLEKVRFKSSLNEHKAAFLKR